MLGDAWVPGESTAPGPSLIRSVRATPATRTGRERMTSKGLPDTCQRTGEHKMPRVEVLSEVPGADRGVVLSEHVPSGMFADEYYAERLVERIGRAFLDAERHEQQSTRVADVGRAARPRPNP